MSVVNFNQKVLCKNCTEDIFSQHTVLLRCTVCTELDLCPDCFAAGAQLGDHLPQHPYKVIDNGGFALLRSSWSAREHVQLLDSVEQFGYGNWEDIARQITQTNVQGAVRTPEESRAEFSNVFIAGALGRHTWNEEQRGRSRDHTQGNPLLPPSAPSEPPANLTITESIMLGYMPKRDDFEVEYDNEAERLVSQLHGGHVSNGPDEDEVDVALNCAHVDMYKFKLMERERRKKVSRDHLLISQYFKENPVSLGERRSTFGQKTSKRKEPRLDLTERLKVLAEFQGVAEHQAFMASVVKEKELKNRVKDLLRFRKNGITTLKDSTEYEIQRLRRIKRRNELRKKFDTGFNDTSASSPMAFKDELGYVASPIGSALSPSKSLTELNSIIGLPGYEVLSLNERKLCSNLRLTPAHYISYKTCLLTTHIQKKKGQSPKPLNPEGLDKNNRKIILQFLIRSGWVQTW